MVSSGVVPLIFLLLLIGCSARPLYPLPSRRNDKTKQPLQTFRPFNIAHRGSNGELPEETAAAYMRAIEEGADFIETDILASKDGALICFHDVFLDDMTDIAEHKEFANRKRTYDVQGINTTGYFTVDFTLNELKSLRLKQRYPFRDQQHNGKFSLITFEEFISIALDAPRVVGIYPEIKNPVLINQHVKWPGGKKFEDKFVETLEKYGYRGSYLSKHWLKQPAFIQSFAPTSLIYISNQTDMPKIFLIDDVTIPCQDTNQVSLFCFTLEVTMLCLSSRPWLGYIHQGHFLLTPLSYETLEYAASFSSDQCAEGVVAVAGDASRVFTIERLGETFNETTIPLRYTPRKFVLQPKRKLLVIIESDQGTFAAEEREAARKECYRIMKLPSVYAQ